MSTLRNYSFAACIAACAGAMWAWGDRSPPAETASKPGMSTRVSGIASRTRVLRQYGQLPMTFEVNQGQTDPKVKFLARGPGYSLFLTPNEAVFSLRTTAMEQGAKNIRGAYGTDADRNVRQTVMRVALAGANHNPAISGIEQQAGRSNYFRGNDPKQWRRDIARYGRVKYAQVYPGIDLVYYGNQRQLEYDFIVAPGRDPRRIEMQFKGVDAMRLDATGNLILRSAQNDITQRKPIVYQEIAGERRPVAGNYRLLADNRVAIEVGRYDNTRPLVIDPVLVYSSYLGGSDYDLPFSLAVDSAGNAYITGATLSPDFPTRGAQVTPASSVGQAFITKINAAGSALIYSTYLGGADPTQGDGIAVDQAGNVYVSGGTTAADFPTVSALQPTLNGARDAFIVKLNSTGDNLLYSTYLGGSDNEEGWHVAIDTAGNAFVAGSTTSTDFPTQAPFQGTYGGGSDAFVTKLNPTGTALVYSTYFGGTGLEIPQSFAIDRSGNAFVSGQTSSEDLPTKSPFQASYGGGDDAFISKFSSGGNSLAFSTYLGGTDHEDGRGIAVDSRGNVYVTGVTASTDFPTINPMQGTNAGLWDIYVTKLNVVGRAVYSTYLGGSGYDAGNSIGLDNAGNISLAGFTRSANFPVASPLQATSGGGDDAFFAKLTAAGNTVLYSTYLGGAGTDSASDLAMDSAGNAYIVGSTNSTNFPLSAPFQPTFNGGFRDGFVAKIGVAPDATAPQITPIIVGTLGDNGWYRGKVTVGWDVFDGESVISSTTGCNNTALKQDTIGATIVCSAMSPGGVATASVSIKIDSTPPTVNALLDPVFLLRAVVTPSADAWDNLSGLATNTCDPLVTGKVGIFKTSCTATDMAGNKTLASLVYYVRYGSDDFAAPIANQPTINVMRYTEIVLFRFHLYDATGAAVTDATKMDMSYFYGWILGKNCQGTSRRISELVSTTKLVNLGGGNYQIGWQPDKYTRGQCVIPFLLETKSTIPLEDRQLFMIE